MRLRGWLMMVLATVTLTVTSGCVVVEAAFITTHTYHGTGTRNYDPSELRAAPPRQTPARRTVDVPAEGEPTP